MLILYVVAMMAQAPAALPPSKSDAKKNREHCEIIEVTGSRRPQRVCRDEEGKFNLGPDIANSGPNPGMFHPPPPAPAPAGLGGRPQ